MVSECMTAQTFNGRPIFMEAWYVVHPCASISVQITDISPRGEF